MASQEVSLINKNYSDESETLYVFSKNQFHAIQQASIFQMEPVVNILPESSIILQDEPYQIQTTAHFTCEECDENFQSNEDLISHKEAHSLDKKLYKCLTCNKVFVSNYNLMTHMRVHTGQKPFNCTYCAKTFSQRSALTIHKRIHTGERPYECGECGKCFTQINHLNKHKRTHSNEKPYFCEQCDTLFSDSSTLRQHVRRHQVKPLNCTICNKVFEKKSLFNLHMMEHKGIAAEECDICRKPFSSKSLLTSHKRSHFKEKTFTCDFCGKICNRMVTLKKHLKYYHGLKYVSKQSCNMEERLGRNNSKKLKPFKCHECDLMFTDNSEFLSHEQTHQVSKEFKCQNCDMSFAKKYTLEIHQQMHISQIASTATSTTKNTTSSPTVSFPVVTIPVVSSLPLSIREQKDEPRSYDVVKFVSMQSMENSNSKTLSESNDPLLVAASAAQLTSSDLMENLTFVDSPYTYYMPTTVATMTDIEGQQMQV